MPRANWQIIIEECINYKVSQVFQTKDQMAEATCKLFNTWKDKGVNTNFSGWAMQEKTNCLSSGRGARICSIAGSLILPNGYSMKYGYPLR